MLLKVFGIRVGFNSVSHCFKSVVISEFCSLFLLLLLFFLKIFHIYIDVKNSVKPMVLATSLSEVCIFLFHYPEWAGTCSCSTVGFSAVIFLRHELLEYSEEIHR